MKFLLRLYPRGWRDRYGAEFEALLRLERLGSGVLIDIAITGLRLRSQEIIGEIGVTGSQAVATFRGSRRTTQFAIGMSWFGALIGFSNVGSLVVPFSFLAATLATNLLSLLSQTANERDAQNARMTLALILFLTLTLHLWSFGSSFTGGSFPNPWHPQSSYLGLLLATCVVDHPWPAEQRLKIVTVSIWASTLQIAGVLCLVALGGNWMAGVLVGAVWGLLTLSMLGERRRLLDQIYLAAS